MHWFNTDTGKEEIVSLPSRTIEVKAKNTSSSASPPPTLTKPTTQPVASYKGVLLSPLIILHGVACGFAIAWLITLGLLWFRKIGSKPEGKRAILKQLHNACIKNDPREAETLLLRWATLYWPNNKPLNLNHIAKLIPDTSFKNQLANLTQALYSQEKGKQWRGEGLWESMMFLFTQKTKEKERK